MIPYDPRAQALEVYAPAWALVTIRTLAARHVELPTVLFPKAAPSSEDQALLHGIGHALDEVTSLPPSVRRLLWTEGPWLADWRWSHDLAKGWLAMLSLPSEADMEASEIAKRSSMELLLDTATARQVARLYDQLWRVPNWSTQPATSTAIASAYTALHAALQEVATAHSTDALLAWLESDDDPDTPWGAALIDAKRALIEAGVGAPRG